MVCCSIERERGRENICCMVWYCVCLHVYLCCFVWQANTYIYTILDIHECVCIHFGDISQCHGRTIDIHVPEMSTERRWDFCRPFFYCASWGSSWINCNSWNGACWWWMRCRWCPRGLFEAWLHDSMSWWKALRKIRNNWILEETKNKFRMEVGNTNRSS